MNTRITIVPFIYALIIHDQICRSDCDGRPGDQQQDFQYHYDNNYQSNIYHNNYIDQQDTYYRNIPQTSNPVLCYTCLAVFSNGKLMGSSGCVDPFDRSGVNVRECHSHCAKVYAKGHNETHFTIHRECMENCHDTETSVMYTKCCSENYCNHANTLHTVSNSSLHKSLFICFVLLLPLIIRLSVV